MRTRFLHKACIGTILGSAAALFGLPGGHVKAQMPVSSARASVQHLQSGLVTTNLAEGKLTLGIPRVLLNRELVIVGRITSGTTDPQFENVPGLGPNHGPIPWTPFVNAIVRISEEPGSMLRVRRYAATGGEDKSHDEGGDTLAEAAITRRDNDTVLTVDAQILLQQSKLGFHGKWATKPDAARFTRAISLPDHVELNAVTEGKEGSIGLQWSLRTLPKKVMPFRLHDDRVNYSSNGSYIERWRLVKKDTTVPVSAPLKPIAVYLDPSIPARFRKSVIQGIQQWERAFAAAGFKNDFVIKQASPTDPDWSPFDLRPGILVWWMNGLGGNCWKLSDPRSGELLSAVVSLGDNLWDYRDEYFFHAGGSDTAAAAWPVPERIFEAAVRTLTAHELGHALGVDHDFMTAFPADKLRDAKWTAREGSSPTIMGYNLFNRVAQPEDHVPVAGLIPHVGASDVFAVHWGYAEVPNAPTPQAEKAVLDRWATDAQRTSWLRYTREEGTFGDIDPWEHFPKSDAAWPAWAREHLARAPLYMHNLQRIYARVITYHASGPQQDQSLLLSLWDHRSRPLKGVAEIVSSPVSGSLKREALRLLNEEAFRVPAYLYTSAYTKRWDENLVKMFLRSQETDVLRVLLDETHTRRLMAHAASSGYSLHDLAADLDEAFCRELREPKVGVSPQRQVALRVYVEELKALISPPKPSGNEGGSAPTERASAETLAILSSELAKVTQTVHSAINRSADSETRAYLQELSKDLAGIAAASTP